MKTLAGALIAVLALFILTAQRADLDIDRNRLPAPVTDADYYENGAPSSEKVELGRLLFFDKILSGNKNISCATCHHPDQGTSDGLSLGFGEGPSGLGPKRTPGTTEHDAIHERVPRNAPALFNLGAREFSVMFHDGRVEADTVGYYKGGFITPAKWKLPTGLDNVLAAQAMFPVTSATEMAGQKGENPVADAISLNKAAGPTGVWAILAKRLQGIPEYVDLFQAAFPDQVSAKEDITMILAANAIAAFEATAFRADNSAFDQYLRQERTLSPEALRGMDLFYGKAQCSTCHAGQFQTDHDFHAIAMPQIGPGKSDGFDPTYWEATGQRAFLEDFGRGRVTVKDEDQFKFRTPSLRNVAITGPWGHAGAYPTLEAVVRHHLNPISALEQYQTDMDVLPPLNTALETFSNGPQLKHRIISQQRFDDFIQRDTWVLNNDVLRDRIAAANELDPVYISDGDVGDLLAFLENLTDSSSLELASLVPARVPSGLPVDD